MVKEKFDVIVAGGGPAGIGAAVAAARQGAKTLVIERYGFLGGNMTHGLPLFVFHSHNGEKIIDGIPQEMVDRLVELQGSFGHLQCPPDAHHPTYTLIDPEMVKYAAQQLVLDAGAELLLHSFVVSGQVEQDRVKTLQLVNKSGMQTVSADVFVDASGDGDLAASAGVPFSKGHPETGYMQAMTMEMKVGNINVERATDWLNQGLTIGKRPWEKTPAIVRGEGNFGPFDALVKESGLFPEAGHKIWFNSFRPGEMNINTTRIINKDSTDGLQMTEAEIEARRQVFNVFWFLKKHVPGFEHSHLISTPVQVGVRESRRILADYVLTEDDVMEGRRFPDGIARGAYPIDIHNAEEWHVAIIKDGSSYDIPYRCITARGVENLLTAGRCISTNHFALGSTRVMAVAMAVGQAAGCAAAAALNTDSAVRAVDPEALRGMLRKQGANLG